MSHVSTQPQTSSTETTSPQVRQANLLPFLIVFLFVVVLFFFVVVFFVFVANAIPPYADFSVNTVSEAILYPNPVITIINDGFVRHCEVVSTVAILSEKTRLLRLLAMTSLTLHLGHILG